MGEEAYDRIDADLVAREADLPELVGRYGIKLTRRGREYEALCPFHTERTASFRVYRKGDRWRFHCFGCSADGDAIGFVMRVERRAFVDVLKRLAEDQGLADPAVRARVAKQSARRAAEAAEREKRREAYATQEAREIWREAMAPAGTVVETYLRARAVRPELQGGIPPTLRFHPLLRIDDDDRPGVYFMLNGMVAAVQNPDGHIVAVHRTFLKADGSDKADVPKQKAMRGPCWGNAVRFDPAGETLAAGEGIETTLSVRQAARVAGVSMPFWAGLSLGNLGAMWLPPCVKRFLILADADSSKPKQAEQSLRRAAQAQRERRPDIKVLVARPRPGMDFNDMLQQDE